MRLTGILALILTCGAVQAATYPQFALGGGYESVLIVTNKTSFKWTGTMTLYRGNNQAWLGSWKINGQSVPSNQANLTLDPRASKKLLLTEDSQMRSGYLELESTGTSWDTDVATAFFYVFRSSNGSLLDSTATPAAEFSSEFDPPLTDPRGPVACKHTFLATTGKTRGNRGDGI